MKPRRHPAGGQLRHADDWLMTYADTITLLLCLFAVLLALHGTNLQHADHIAAPATAGPPPSFTSPQATIVVAPLREFAGMPPPQMDTDDDRDDPTSYPSTLPNPQALPTTNGLATASKKSISIATAAFTGPAAVPIAHPVPAAIAPPSPAANPANAPITAPMNVRLNPRPSAGEKAARDPIGDRITIFQFSSTAFFPSGTATLSDSGQSILKNLLGRLQSPAFAAYRITVEGHTDDEPISSPQFPSNWELSAARAAAVVRFFIEHGIPPDRLRAAGYADTRPLVPNRDTAGNPIPQNQAQNRRVVIELDKIDHAGA